jgi:hypothetical protein
MTTQEEDQYIHELLPEMAQKATGYDISGGGAFYPDELLPVVNRLETEGLALPTNYKYSLTITPKGKRIAEIPGGYIAYLKQQEKDAFWERFRANATVWATIISALAAVVSIGIAIWLNNSLDKTNAEVDILIKRVQALEAQTKQ